VTPFAIDMYLPAFMKIAVEFGTSTSEISISLSTYLVGFALGQLVLGPLLDRFGRRRPLHAGLTMFILCSVGCAIAPSLKVFATLRFLQALGGCAAQVAAIAMLRDFFPVRESSKILSLLCLMIGISPLLAPTIGSSIVQHSKWQWIFVLLAAIACIVMTCTFLLLPEGHQPDLSASLRPDALARSFWKIIEDPRFRTYSLTGTFSFAGLFAFVASSPPSLWTVFIWVQRLSVSSLRSSSWAISLATKPTYSFFASSRVHKYWMQQCSSRY
jgi:MFS transporter, DHA1 family, multidrug resistance protein